LDKRPAFPIIPGAGKTAKAAIKSPRKGKSKQVEVITVKYNTSSDDVGDARERVQVPNFVVNARGWRLRLRAYESRRSEL
jgi:hypothetical protein